MVFGSHVKTCAMYSIPPWPSLAASTAAYRRRSFSDNHPKKRCIFSSISAEYTSMLDSLRQNLSCRKDTTPQACREVILDHILRARGFHHQQCNAPILFPALLRRVRGVWTRCAIGSGLEVCLRQPSVSEIPHYREGPRGRQFPIRGVSLDQEPTDRDIVRMPLHYDAAHTTLCEGVGDPVEHHLPRLG